MRKSSILLLTLSLLIAGCRETPALENNHSASETRRLKAQVEFVSEPLQRLLSFPPWGLKKPRIAVGDITGDNQPELILAMGGWASTSQYKDQPDLFYGHPLVFSWNGETFERLDADWAGIPFSEKQALTRVVMIADVDSDNVNEAVVGTAPHHDAGSRGAVYIFQWNGERFVAEFSEYCVGSVVRLDSVVQEEGVAVVISASMCPNGYDAEQLLCPMTQVPEEPTKGLYVLQAVERDKYEIRPLVVDGNSLTALVLGSGYLSDTQFIRLNPVPSSSPTMADWSTPRAIQVDGQVREDSIQIEIEYPVLQMEAADLEGDGIDEIVVMAAKGWDGSGSAGRDEAIWQVFTATRDGYHLAYEGPVVFSPTQVGWYEFFAVGDTDSDGMAEIVASSGIIYDWEGGRLTPQMDLTDTIGADLYLGLENIYVGDVYGDGQNRIVFTGRYSSQGEVCPDSCFPRMYVVSVGV